MEIYRIGKPDGEQGKLWQALKERFRKKKQPVPGIFDVFRGSKAAALNFRIVPAP